MHSFVTKHKIHLLVSTEEHTPAVWPNHEHYQQGGEKGSNTENCCFREAPNPLPSILLLIAHSWRKRRRGPRRERQWWVEGAAFHSAHQSLCSSRPLQARRRLPLYPRPAWSLRHHPSVKASSLTGSGTRQLLAQQQ